ncbi:MAG: glycine cleavage system protein GcvH [Deltaproteobacteria bacterium]|nr:glycine cleavage system protein GcvH [Deltaproteobacteria bacterium]
MAHIPDDLRYTQDHEWIRKDGDELIIGITDHAQSSLGDVVYVELPEVGDEVSAGAPFGTVESTKAVSELFAPVSGEVTAVNEDLVDAPEKVNEDPYGDAWMIRVKPASADAYDGLLDDAAYAAHVESDS